MVWRPAKTLGLLVGLVILVTLVGVDVFLLRSALSTGLGLNLYFIMLLFVLSLPLLALFLYWYYSLVTLGYRMDRNALLISCGDSQHVVPMTAIRRIVPGHKVAALQGFRGVGWPGFLMGTLQLRDLGTLMVYGTEPLERQLIVVTDRCCYGISPRHAARFQEDFAQRQGLGPVHEVTQTVLHARFVASPVWADRWFWLIVLLTFVANAILAGVIADRYVRLPDRIPLHFDARGQVDRIVAKTGLLVIPAIGALTLLVNGALGLAVFRRERLAAYLAVLMALALQAVLWVAAWGVLQ
jgi:hypothetical protein